MCGGFLKSNSCEIIVNLGGFWSFECREQRQKSYYSVWVYL